MATIESKIQELEAQLALLRSCCCGGHGNIADKSAPGREKTRLTKGQEHTLESSGKIGGAFKVQENPNFIEERIKIYDEIAEVAKTRFASQPRVPITITLPDGSTKEGTSFETTPLDICKLLSNSLAKKVCVAEVAHSKRVCEDDVKIADAQGDMFAEADDGASSSDKKQGELWDLNRPFEGDASMKLYTFEDDLGKMVFWHSCAHVLGQGMERSFGCKLTVGPPVKDGYYYDGYCGTETCTEEKWYPKLDALTKKITDEKQTFERLVVTKEEAMKMFAYNPFKVEIIRTKVPDGTSTTVYRNGPFIDLCMGPHVPNTSVIKAMKCFKHSAAYWMGDEDADNLQRVYGVGFPDKKLLKKWEIDFQARKERDHRKIGPQQDLFFFHDLSPGSCFFLPQGARVYNKLMDYIKDEYWERGYTEVVSPNIFHTDLWKISGHYEHYKDDMFLFNTADDEEYGLKPMNCPGHCLMFREKLRSYRELPLRLADFGVLHRNERSGALSGLTRVRRFQQDDAHVFCRPDQVQEEVVKALEFMKSVYGVFGMRFKLERSTRPKKAVGADTPEGIARWDSAEAALSGALDAFAGKGNWRDNPGDGAFYGPKIDIKVYDCMDRKHQCATVQLDFQLPIRFDLKYRSQDSTTSTVEKEDKGNGKKAAEDDANKDGAKSTGKVWKNLPNEVANPGAGWERPVMVHRAMLGSVERMFAILTEHFAGKFPLWLNPRQVIVIPVHADLTSYGLSLQERFRAHKMFCDVDTSNKTLKKMIREAQINKYNYILVVGQNEAASDTVAVRKRDEEKETRDVPVEEFIATLKAEIDSKVWYPPAEKEAVAPAATKGGKKAPKDAAAPKGAATPKGVAAPKDKGAKAPTAAVGGVEDAFSAIDIRVGHITKAWPHPDSDKLWCEEIECGEEAPRQVASGLRAYYTQEEMTDRKILVVCNLKSSKLGGFASSAMVLCAKKGDKVEFIDPPAGAAVGERIMVAGSAGDAASPAQVKKRKLLEAMLKDLKTDDKCVCTWVGKPLTASTGPCTAPSLDDAPVS